MTDQRISLKILPVTSMYSMTVHVESSRLVHLGTSFHSQNLILDLKE